jgi:hypothetical protein
MKSEGFVPFRANARNDSYQVSPIDWKKVTPSVYRKICHPGPRYAPRRYALTNG